MNTQLKKILLASVLAVGIGCNNETSQPPVHPPVMQEVVVPKLSLDQRILEDAKKRTSIQDLTVKNEFLTSNSIPFVGYVSGNYYVASTDDKKYQSYFSKIGKFIGSYQKVKDTETYRERKLTEGNSTWLKVYVKTKSGWKLDHTSSDNTLGETVRSYRSGRESAGSPIYIVDSQSKLKSDGRYSGTFGGDGAHVVEGKRGLIFVVQTETYNKGKLKEQHGELFDQRGRFNDYNVKSKDVIYDVKTAKFKDVK